MFFCYNIYMFVKLPSKGFTLLELLIVIAIIGIISTVSLVNLENARAKARDARRLSDIDQIQRALEIYYTNNAFYPNTECYQLPSIVSCSSILSPGNWISDLGIVLPDDPLNKTANDGTVYSYLFTRKDPSTVPYQDYYFLLYNLETQPINDQCNGNSYPGFSCVGGGNMP